MPRVLPFDELQSLPQKDGAGARTTGPQRVFCQTQNLLASKRGWSSQYRIVAKTASKSTFCFCTFWMSTKIPRSSRRTAALADAVADGVGWKDSASCGAKLVFFWFAGFHEILLLKTWNGMVCLATRDATKVTKAFNFIELFDVPNAQPFVHPQHTESDEMLWIRQGSCVSNRFCASICKPCRNTGCTDSSDISENKICDMYIINVMYCRHREHVSARAWAFRPLCNGGCGRLNLCVSEHDPRSTVWEWTCYAALKLWIFQKIERTHFHWRWWRWNW